GARGSSKGLSTVCHQHGNSEPRALSSVEARTGRAGIQTMAGRRPARIRMCARAGSDPGHTPSFYTGAVRPAIPADRPDDSRGLLTMSTDTPARPNRAALRRGGLVLWLTAALVIAATGGLAVFAW